MAQVIWFIMIPFLMIISDYRYDSLFEFFIEIMLAISAGYIVFYAAASAIVWVKKGAPKNV